MHWSLKITLLAAATALGQMMDPDWDPARSKPVPLECALCENPAAGVRAEFEQGEFYRKLRVPAYMLRPVGGKWLLSDSLDFLVSPQTGSDHTTLASHVAALFYRPI
ncbi:MAG: hypothetical protein V1913_12000, partial [Fibrobacterota bacterium]